MDKRNKIFIFTVAIVVLMALVVFSMGNNTTPSTDTQNTNGSKVNTTTLNQTGSINSVKISSTELAKHNKENDCWVVYKGQVYDLTSWLPRHPGSAGAILPYCGTQGFEAAFTKQHGNSKASLFMQVAKLIGQVEVKGSI
ncbi:MAG: cytochrome b5-like heme/steroid binding domain-containing protein [Nanoarchaeota archaeon]